MRLINAAKRKLEEFVGDETPLYAILSHTWGENEITFQDIQGTDVENKVGYKKIRNTCSKATVDGYDYVWIDTCCIDTTSSAELSEAINSMYRWYQESGVCYAYLADVMSKGAKGVNRPNISELSKSKWFTRGWTLQELLAPSTVIFLDQEWQEMGTKSSLQSVISEITGIPTNVLQGGDLESTSIAQRMSWASKRETRRVEDLAYCLMGIFGINMHMLYGEGKRAFTRLQEEIMKVSDDHSLFAWKSFENPGGLLAVSPAAFVNSKEIVPVNPSSNLSGAITVNNKGIHLKLRFMDNLKLRSMDRMASQDLSLAILPCTEKGKEVAIYVRAMPDIKDYFVRAQSDRLELLNLKDFTQLEYREKHLCVRQERLTYKNQSPLSRAAEKGQEMVVKQLLDNGADVESKDNKYGGRTPLLWAAEKGHKAVVNLLLKKGAQLESKTSSGQTPLSSAAEKGHDAVVKLLLDEGADVQSKTSSGRTPLLLAAEKGHEAVVKLLLDKGADVKSKTDSGRTPLLLAAEKGHETVVKLLLDNGADVESMLEMHSVVSSSSLS